MLSVNFKAKFAHFAMPPLKAEGRTWDVPPPSALRGAIEAVCYKPQVYWDVRRVEVLRPIRHFHLKSNGLWDRVVGFDRKPDTRINQQNLVLLRRVEYVVHFEPRLCRRGKGGRIVEFDPAPAHDANVAKYVAMVERRIRKGQCYRQPYLGSGFCLAYFGPPSPDREPIPESADFGMVTHGIEYGDDGDHAAFFHRALMRDGVLEFPSFFDLLKERHERLANEKGPRR